MPPPVSPEPGRIVRCIRAGQNVEEFA